MLGIGDDGQFVLLDRAQLEELSSSVSLCAFPEEDVSTELSDSRRSAVSRLHVILDSSIMCFAKAMRSVVVSPLRLSGVHPSSKSFFSS